MDINPCFTVFWHKRDPFCLELGGLCQKNAVCAGLLPGQIIFPVLCPWVCTRGTVFLMDEGWADEGRAAQKCLKSKAHFAAGHVVVTTKESAAVLSWPPHTLMPCTGTNYTSRPDPWLPTWNCLCFWKAAAGEMYGCVWKRGGWPSGSLDLGLLREDLSSGDAWMGSSWWLWFTFLMLCSQKADWALGFCLPFTAKIPPLPLLLTQRRDARRKGCC